eukprot:m.115979 g.115979  ORF g.115979 m.115979 type:complete len:69 (-) comp12845_c0_seq24:400-606(-)
MLIERVDNLYNIESFEKELRALMAEYVLKVFQRHPGLVVDQKDNLREFAVMKNAFGGKEEVKLLSKCW